MADTTKKNQKTTGGKVGSDINASHQLGGKGDFGTPVHSDVVRDMEPQIEGRPAGSAPGNTGARGNRTTGVGSPAGEAGHGSGGDLDPDWIGLDGHGGISAKPVSGHTDGPDDAPSGTGATRAEKHGEKHGASHNAQGDYLDHSGTDTGTVDRGAAGSVSAPRGNQIPGAEGEITGDEASGNLDQGAEV